MDRAQTQGGDSDMSDNPNCVLIGANIRAARKSMRLNQSQMGKLLGVTRQTVLSWERADTAVPSNMLMRIAQLVGLKDVSWFFEEKP